MFYKNQKREKFTKKLITPFRKQVWLRKSYITCHISYLPKHEKVKGRWYFDSGCSHCMTGEKANIKELKTCEGNVTFSDGIKG